MHPLRIAALACLIASTACLESPEVDLVGPRVAAASLQGPRSVEVSVTPELIIDFSEALDPASIHPGSVALIAWEPLDSCSRTPICDEGSCERGTCQVSPLKVTQRRALDRGTYSGESVELVHELGVGPAGPGTRLTIRARRPLAAHRRHSLIVGAAVRDRSGAPLVDEWGRIAGFERDFVTAGRGSGGPEPRLIAPAPGQAGVPTNVAAIDTEFWPPIPPPGPDATLWLEPEEPGERLVLIDPITCPGWAPGACLRWRSSGPLAENTRYRPAGGSVLDRHGRPVLLPAAEHETWFRVGSGPDLEPPRASATAQMRGRCLAVWIDAGEPVEALLRVGEAEQRAAIAELGWIGLGIDEELDPEQRVAWTIELRDLADNRATLEGEVAAGASFASSLPRVSLTEILANPSGPEPVAEFVELLAGPSGASLEGVYLADMSLAEVREAWASGKTQGDALPAVELEPNEVAVVVATGYAEIDPVKDPQPPSSTRLLVVDKSLGNSGLKNEGEPVILWALTEHGPTLISSYGNWINTAAKAHEGRSVVAGSDGCDLPDRWRSHPFGRSTPGTLP
ncbi:MAG: hypothetical protein R6X02_25835 [Enhygromyxa sp.]